MVQNLVEKAKRNVPAVEQAIEPGLVYPLLRWGDVRRWSARPSAHVLLAQDVATRTGIAESLMRREYPRTYAYLKQFEPVLVGRAAYRRYQGRKPFYSMYNVGTYTLSPIKVVWRRMDRWIRAAVVESIDDPLLGRRPVVPQETCVLIACGSADEAHYLCAMLNSDRRQCVGSCPQRRRWEGFWHARHVGVSRAAAFRAWRSAARGVGRVQPPGARAYGGFRGRGGVPRVDGRAGGNRPSRRGAVSIGPRRRRSARKKSRLLKMDWFCATPFLAFDFFTSRFRDGSFLYIASCVDVPGRKCALLSGGVLQWCHRKRPEVGYSRLGICFGCASR